MKKTILLLVCAIHTLLLVAQDAEKAHKLVTEGIELHDKGQFEAAIGKYDKALATDRNNLMALAEKALSSLSLQQFDKALSCCQLAIEKHPGDKMLQSVYVSYGTAYDGLKKADKALAAYDEGIQLFPDYYQLHYNKGITLIGMRKYDDALLCFQTAVVYNPSHGSSHNAIARLQNMKNKRIPAVLAYCRFLAIEPESGRAKENLGYLLKILSGDVEQTDKKNITLHIDPSILGDTLPDGKPKENSFSTTDLIMSMSAALDFDKKNKKKTEVERFIGKMETICSSLKETRAKNYGFYWNYYVPYFIEMKENKHLETFAYLAFSTSEDKTATKWLKNHPKEIEDFLEWSKNFGWER